MCGFVGIINRDGMPLGSDSLAILHKMGEQIAHRGPDDSRDFCEGPLGVVFNRLSIVDLTSGQQPFFNEERSVMMVVNGEIYNHKTLKSQLKGNHHFQGSSDCEVLIHLYEELGIDGLKMVNGMFALAIWDMRLQRLFLARDRLGIKPLYYTQFNHQLAFASEFKSLLVHPDCPRQFDWFEALSGRNSPLLEQKTLPTCFKDIHYLPAGTVMSVDFNLNQVSQQNWWTYPILTDEEQAADRRNEKDIIKEYGEKLETAVSRRLMSDVDIGLFLSGGIDSVAIAVFAAQSLKDLQTFSVYSQSTFQNGDAKAGFEAASYLGLNNHQVNFSWHSNSFKASDWKSLVWLLETPEINAEHLYKYHLHHYAKYHYPQLKVMLLGQGSDEFNGGYSHVYLEKFKPNLQAQYHNWPALMTLMKEIESHYLSKGKLNDISHFGELIRPEFMAKVSHSQLSHNRGLKSNGTKTYAKDFSPKSFAI